VEIGVGGVHNEYYVEVAAHLLCEPGEQSSSVSEINLVLSMAYVSWVLKGDEFVSFEKPSTSPLASRVFISRKRYE